MSLILHIDTHLQTATVSLAEGKKVIHSLSSLNQKEHASFLQPAIRQILVDTSRSIAELDAIAVVAGPGSYTGLRVGLSTAKGLCYALQIPLIAINSLEWMAYAAKDEPVDLLCPMIDARRNEVFAAVYRRTGEEVESPASVILHSDSYKILLRDNKILFFGDGSEKFRVMFSDNNAIFTRVVQDCSQLAEISSERFEKSVFTDLAYSEPIYVKGFFKAPAPQQAL